MFFYIFNFARVKLNIKPL